MAGRDPDAKPDYGIPVHPVCDLFPLIEGDDFLGLCSDIRQHGLIHPIVVHNGQLVDGRNRFLACEDLGVKPAIVQWSDIYKGSMSITRWIWSVNVERRHLTLDQILAIEVQVHAYEEREAARQRQKTGKSADSAAGGRGRKQNLPANSPEGLPHAKKQKDRSGETVIKIAKEVGTTEHKARQALAVRKTDLNLLKQVSQGKTTLRDAAKKVAPPKPKPAVARGAAHATELEAQLEALKSGKITASQAKALVKDASRQVGDLANEIKQDKAALKAAYKVAASPATIAESMPEAPVRVQVNELVDLAQKIASHRDDVVRLGFDDEGVYEDLATVNAKLGELLRRIISGAAAPPAGSAEARE